MPAHNDTYGRWCLPALGLDGWLVGLEDEGGSDIACGVGVGEGMSDVVGGSPACAVAGNDEVWGEGD